jgi:5-methylcytosine-specific restriction endonuclease McrA
MAFLNAAGEILGEDWNTYESTQMPVTDEERERRRMTPATRLRIFERDDYECQWCGAKDGLEIDHIVPISRGGSSDDDNLQVLCVPCNRSKGAKTLEEWSGRR